MLAKINKSKVATSRCFENYFSSQGVFRKCSKITCSLTFRKIQKKTSALETFSKNAANQELLVVINYRFLESIY